MNKKAISPVVAIALLLVVAVVAVVGFQTWNNDFQSGVFTNVESQSSKGVSVEINEMIDGVLYVKSTSDDNITVNTIKVGDTVCNFTATNLTKGINEIILEDCLNDTEVKEDVVLITEDYIDSKTFYLGDDVDSTSVSVPNPDCSLDGIDVINGTNETFYKYDKPYNSNGGCSAISQTRNCLEGTLDGSNEYDTGVCNDSKAPTQGGEWVLAFSNSSYGTSDFYVMKWEAKNVGGVPTSQANTVPWTGITQPNARSECNSLDGSDDGDYHLITNEEWMTIGRNMEGVSSNWADGVIGSTIASGGGLKRGNGGLSDSATYIGGAKLSGTSRDSKSLLNLSNEEGIWDFSGNAWEWTNETIDCSGGYPCTNMPYDSTPEPEWPEFVDLNTYGKFTYDLIRPSNATWNSDYGVGKLYTDNDAAQDGGNIHAVSRGGRYEDEIITGIYAFYTRHGISTTNLDVGFRCTYVPNQ
jgi:formylglycine-generating enzyme required for sulfatase activity